MAKRRLLTLVAPRGRAAFGGRWAVVALTSSLFVSSVAFADERSDCAAAADQAQQLRDEGKYRRGREQLLVCARDVCPGPIKRDCLEWLTQLDSIAPTVVLGAKDGAKDLVDVKVSVDGVAVTERLDGKPIPMDLGQHTFKFEYQGKTKEETVVIGAGQKSRNISVVFGASGGGAPPPGPGPAPPPSQQSEGGSLVPAFIVGGIGVVGLIGFTVFGLTGKSAVDDLRDGPNKCAPNCKESDVDAARTKLILADISLGIGVVALAVATYMILTRPKIDVEGGPPKAARATERPKTSSSLLLDVGPARGGGAVGAVGLSF